MQRLTWFILVSFITLYLPFLIWGINESFSDGFEFSTFYSLMFSEGNVIIFFKSLLFAVLSSVLSLLWGLFVAITLLRSGLRYIKWSFVLFLLPLAIPSFVFIEVIVFISEITQRNFFNLPMMILLLSFIYMPICAFIIGAGLKAIPKIIEEAAILVSPGNKWFTNITLRWMWPYFLTAFSITFIFSFSNYEIPSLMNTPMYSLFVFNQFGAFYNFKNTIFLLYPVCILLFVIVFIQKAIIGKRAFFDLHPIAKGIQIETTNTITFTQKVLLGFFIGIVLLPVFVLLFKMYPFSNLFQNVLSYSREIGYSLIISIASAFFTIFISAMYVKAMYEAKSKIQDFLFSLSLLPLAIPSALIAIGLIKTSNAYMSSSSTGASLLLIWGLSAKYLPIVIHILYANVLSISPSNFEAAKLICPRSVNNFWHIWLPLNKTGIVRAFIFFLLVSMADIGIAVLLVPPDCMTASINIYSMLHYGFGKEVAIESFLMLFTIVFIGVMALQFDKTQFRGSELRNA